MYLRTVSFLSRKEMVLRLRRKATRGGFPLPPRRRREHKVRTRVAAVRMLDCLVRRGVRCRYLVQVCHRLTPAQAARKMWSEVVKTETVYDRSSSFRTASRGDVRDTIPVISTAERQRYAGRASTRTCFSGDDCFDRWLPPAIMPAPFSFFHRARHYLSFRARSKRKIGGRITRANNRNTKKITQKSR